MKIAAIDIGSNGARLKIVDVIINKQKITEFNKLSFLRLPLRLGFDVFEKGEIGEENTKRILSAMLAFKSLVSFYDVKSLRVCATSAMRDAKNSKQIVEMVESQTGLKIDIISGDEEATLVHENHIADNMDRKHGYLYVNVGGGSTDLIFFIDGKLRYKKSINIGTIRILKNAVKESDWNTMKDELKNNIKSNLPMVAIGSGGNINKIFSLSEKKEGKPLSIELLKKYYKDLNTLSVEDRMHLFGLREDRADVIVPALEIYINLMTWTNIQKIYVPRIGLVDGMTHALYTEIINKG
ncbi:MAG: exopolyphosphatase [Parachlamydiaceae bacterium]|nr:exopolyphosphatase [Parachlamydiaceae bacterium]